MVFVDLRKAFDTVNHQILLHKLSRCGLDHMSLSWFRSYLSNRSQQVVIEGVLSDPAKVNIGVPQGSILGPLLFILFVNDFPSVVNSSEVDLYADDTTICAAGKTVSAIKNVLNSDLVKVQAWLNINRLILNTDKTVCMLVTTKQKSAKINKNLNININGTQIEQVSCAKLLGVWLDEHLCWDKCINTISKKLSQKLGILKRVKKFLPSNSLMLIYNSLVLPHFDYGSVVWGGCK